MKIVFKIDEDDPRNPGVIADCTGDNAGDSVGPSADGFETYGVTGVALVTFVLLAVPDAGLQAMLLVWIFTVRAAMILAAWAAYGINAAWCRARFGDAERMNFETPLTTLVWLTSALCIALTYLSTWLVLGGQELDYGCAWPRSSPAEPSRGRSSPNWSRSSPPPAPSTSARPSSPRARAAPA